MMKSPAKHIPALCLLLVYLILAAATVFAHDPGLSAAELRLEGEALRARLSFSRAEIEPLARETGLEALGREAIEIRVDGQPVPLERVTATIDAESNAIHFDLSFAKRTGARLELRSLLFGRLALGHRQFLSLRGATGETRGARLLDARANGYELDLAAFRESEARPATFWGFLKLGIEHIFFGFDHLAFLFALLLAGSRLREAAGIITSFTIAHSITLGLATFDLIRISPAIVEPLIAVSIIYVGIENLLGRKTTHRWLLTFGFGLIHGFGFATVLRELGIGEAGPAAAAPPLLAFNLGVELGQLAIAALFLPLLWRLRQRPSFAPKYAPACSWLILLAGLYWLIERTILG